MNKEFKIKKLIYVEYLYCKGRRSYDELNDSEKAILSAFILREEEWHNKYSGLSDADDDNLLPFAISSYFLDPEYTAYDLLENIKKVLCCAYPAEINRLLEAADILAKADEVNQLADQKIAEMKEEKLFSQSA